MTQPSATPTPTWWCRTFGHRFVHYRPAMSTSAWITGGPTPDTLTYCARCGLQVTA